LAAVAAAAAALLVERMQVAVPVAAVVVLVGQVLETVPGLRLPARGTWVD
jgi:hypothetical protein